VCKSQRTIESDKFLFDNFVTSDCKPVKFNFSLKNCLKCNHTYKSVDEKLKRKIADIYADYTPYHSGGGREQRIFFNHGFIGRSRYIFESILPHIHIGNISSYLDIGCGVGASLEVMAELKKDVALYGMDIYNGLKQSILSLNNFSGFYKSMNEIPEGRKFDLVTLVHTIEHIEYLDECLRDVDKILSSSGQLVIQIPNAECNPFDYLVLDHLHHFSDHSLKILLTENGFGRVKVFKNLVNKEITLIASRDGYSYTSEDFNSEFPIFSFRQGVHYLNDFFKDLSKKNLEKFYIFGTAISATWLYGCFKDSILGFIDEDQEKHGKDLFALRIKRPEEVLSNEVVVVPLVGPIKSSVIQRMTKYTSNIF